MIAHLDRIATPNGSGLTDFELETEHLQAKAVREMPKFKTRPPIFQRGDRCWVVGIKGCFEGRVTGLRCDTLWVQDDTGNAEMLECDWEYSVTSVKQLTQEPWPEYSGWYKSARLCSVQPHE